MTTRKSIKSPAIKAAVVAKRTLGETKEQISQDLGIAKGTVDVILNEAQLDNLLLQGKSGIYRLIPKMVNTMERALDWPNIEVAADNAVILLKGIGVLADKENSKGAAPLQVQIINHVPRPERNAS